MTAGTRPDRGGDVRFEPGDEVLALVDEASVADLAALFGPPVASSRER